MGLCYCDFWKYSWIWDRRLNNTSQKSFSPDETRHRVYLRWKNGFSYFQECRRLDKKILDSRGTANGPSERKSFFMYRSRCLRASKRHSPLAGVALQASWEITLCFSSVILPPDLHYHSLFSILLFRFLPVALENLLQSPPQSSSNLLLRLSRCCIIIWTRLTFLYWIARIERRRKRCILAFPLYALNSMTPRHDSFGNRDFLRARERLLGYAFTVTN